MPFAAATDFLPHHCLFKGLAQNRLAPTLPLPNRQTGRQSFSKRPSPSLPRLPCKKNEKFQTSPKGQEHIGQLGFSLSRSYQQGYSTTYNTPLHIKVVCNGYALAHISNWNAKGARQPLPATWPYPPCFDSSP
jgi:hypothetical protein